MTLAVVYETLRLAGPAQALLRKTTAPTLVPSKTVAQDGTLAEGDLISIPQGAHVREHVQGVHYTNAWEDPLTFKPERFLEKEKLSEQMKACESLPSQA
jgi:cytochrome P450